MLSPESEGFQLVAKDFAQYALLLNIREKPPEGQSESKIVPFRFNNPQWRYHLFKEKVRELKRPVRIVILKYRQGGFTTYEQADSFWRSATKRNQEIMTIAHIEERAVDIFNMCQLFYKTLDVDFRPDRDKGKAASKLIFPELNSKFVVGWAGSDVIGVTLNKIHLTEFALWKQDPFGQLQKIQEAVPMWGEIIIESTAWGFNEFETLYSMAKKGKNSYIPFFIRWFDDPQYQVSLEPGESLEPYSTEEEALINSYALTDAQIKWRRWKIMDMGGSMSSFWQQYPEDDLNCFMSSGTGFFESARIIAEGLPFANAHPPIQIKRFSASDPSVSLKVWEEPRPGVQYIISGDPAEGIGEDRSAAHVIEAMSGKCCLSFAHDRMPARDFAEWLSKTANHYNRAYMIVEKNNHGHTVLSHLVNDFGYASHVDLYHHEDTLETLKPRRQTIKKRLTKAYKPGFPTQKITKIQMFNNYKSVVEDTPQMILDPDDYEEIKAFMRHPDGTLGADRTKKDDRITSHALAQWARFRGRPSTNYIQQYKVYT